jgi:hypothetical protein
MPVNIQLSKISIAPAIDKLIACELLDGLIFWGAANLRGP